MNIFLKYIALCALIVNSFACSNAMEDTASVEGPIFPVNGTWAAADRNNPIYTNLLATDELACACTTSDNEFLHFALTPTGLWWLCKGNEVAEASEFNSSYEIDKIKSLLESNTTFLEKKNNIDNKDANPASTADTAVQLPSCWPLYQGKDNHPHRVKLEGVTLPIIGRWQVGNIADLPRCQFEDKPYNVYLLSDQDNGYNDCYNSYHYMISMIAGSCHYGKVQKLCATDHAGFTLTNGIITNSTVLNLPFNDGEYIEWDGTDAYYHHSHTSWELKHECMKRAFNRGYKPIYGQCVVASIVIVLAATLISKWYYAQEEADNSESQDAAGATHEQSEIEEIC